MSGKLGRGILGAPFAALAVVSLMYGVVCYLGERVHRTLAAPTGAPAERRRPERRRER